MNPVFIPEVAIVVLVVCLEIVYIAVKHGLAKDAANSRNNAQ